VKRNSAPAFRSQAQKAPRSQNVSAQTDAILRGDAKAGNRHATRYVKAFKKLRQEGNAGRDALAVLLSHPRMDVRAAAAACLLRHLTREAQGILAQAAAGEGLAAPEDER